MKDENLTFDEFYIQISRYHVTNLLRSIMKKKTRFVHCSETDWLPMDYRELYCSCQMWTSWFWLFFGRKCNLYFHTFEEKRDFYLFFIFCLNSSVKIAFSVIWCVSTLLYFNCTLLFPFFVLLWKIYMLKILTFVFEMLQFQMCGLNILL